MGAIPAAGDEHYRSSNTSGDREVSLLLPKDHELSPIFLVGYDVISQSRDKQSIFVDL